MVRWSNYYRPEDKRAISEAKFLHGGNSVEVYRARVDAEQRTTYRYPQSVNDALARAAQQYGTGTPELFKFRENVDRGRPIWENYWRLRRYGFTDKEADWFARKFPINDVRMKTVIKDRQEVVRQGTRAGAGFRDVMTSLRHLIFQGFIAAEPWQLMQESSP